MACKNILPDYCGFCKYFNNYAQLKRGPARPLFIINILFIGLILSPIPKAYFVAARRQLRKCYTSGVWKLFTDFQSTSLPVCGKLYFDFFVFEIKSAFFLFLFSLVMSVLTTDKTSLRRKRLSQAVLRITFFDISTYFVFSV